MKLSGEQIIFGQNSLEHLRTLGGTRAYIVTSGTFLEDSGKMALIRRYLSDAGIESAVCNEVTADPAFDTVQDGARKFQEFKPDIIIGIGGGSALDAAKGMWVLYERPEITSIEQLAACHNHMPRLRNKAILVTIPTTSGTASEVSRSMVISNPVTHVKVGVSDMQLLADVAILDPELTVTLPPRITAETGLDALSHGVESYFSTRANTLSETFSAKSVKLILDNLAAAYNHGTDLKARENMQLGSLMAGIAFSNVSLGLSHGISHTIGGKFGLSHGLLNGIVLPYIILLAGKSAYGCKRLSAMEEELRIDSLFERICDLNNKLDIPAGLAGLVDETAFMNEMDTLVEMSLSDGCTKTTPFIPNVKETRELLIKIYKGELK